MICRLVSRVTYVSVALLIVLSASRAAFWQIPPIQVSPQPDPEPSFFYYGEWGKVPLELWLERFGVRWAAAADLLARERVLANAPVEFQIMGVEEIPSPRMTIYEVSGIGNGRQMMFLLEWLASRPEVELVTPAFGDESEWMLLTDEFIAKFEPEVPEAEIGVVNALEGVEIVKPGTWAANCFILRTLSKSPCAALLTASRYFEGRPVIYSHPNFVYRLRSCTTEPNDFWFPQQWALKNTIRNWWQGMYDADIDGPEAWAITRGSSSVTLAILDTGVDTDHPDLADNLWTNEDEVPGNGQDDDNNGYVDDDRGWDFVGGDNDPNPDPNTEDAAHGTCCAGIVGAVTNNSLGVAGVSWWSNVMAVRVLSGTAAGPYLVMTSASASDPFAYASENGARVISCSWGGWDDDQSLHDAIIAAHKAGCVILASSGNDNKDEICYPARYPEVIAVGATNEWDERCGWWDWGVGSGSNYGQELDVVAPGVNIWTTDIAGSDGYNTEGYDGWRAWCDYVCWYSRFHRNPLRFGNSDYDWLGDYDNCFRGTSAACPFAAGVCALMLSVRPDMSPAVVEAKLKLSCDDVGDPGLDLETGFGRVNAYRAVILARQHQGGGPGGGAFNVSETFDTGAPEWELNGHALIVDGRLRLARAVSQQVGSAVFKTKMAFSTFTASFDLEFPNPGGQGGGADGLTFFFSPGSSSRLMGGLPGGQLGYQGSTQGYSPFPAGSYATEFDIYYNSEYGDPTANHGGIDRDGSVRSLATAPVAVPMKANGVFHGEVAFDRGRFVVHLSNPGAGLPRTKIIDFTDPAFQPDPNGYYIGFTAATDAGWADHYVDKFVFQAR